MTCRIHFILQADIETVDVPTMTYGVRKALVTAAQKREVMDSFDVFYVTKIMATLLPFSDDNAEVSIDKEEGNNYFVMQNCG